MTPKKKLANVVKLPTATERLEKKVGQLEQTIVQLIEQHNRLCKSHDSNLALHNQCLMQLEMLHMVTQRVLNDALFSEDGAHRSADGTVDTVWYIGQYMATRGLIDFAMVMNQYLEAHAIKHYSRLRLVPPLVEEVDELQTEFGGGVMHLQAGAPLILAP